MSRTYTTRQGDTFSSVSRAETGSEKNAQLIKQSNPHASTPFTIGTVLTIPFADSSASKQFNPAGLDVRIDGESVTAYNSFTYSGAIDGFSKVKFVIPNEISTRAIAPMLTPLAVDVGYNGFSMFSGYMETPIPESTDEGKFLTISANSWPNLLLSAPPITCFPLEFENSKIDLVASTLIDPFAIEQVFQSDVGPVFTKLQVKQLSSVMELLSKLCKQRALIMRDDEYGSIVFDNGALIGAPTLSIDDDVRPDVSIRLNIDPNEWYSHITAVLKSKNKKRKNKLVWQNPFYTGITRNHTFEIAESSDGELATAMYSVAARMFASVFSLQITIPGWLNRNGELIRSGQSLDVRSPTNYIEEFTELLFSAVTLTGTPEAKVSVIDCVLPGCYGGKIPEAIPWK